MAKNLLVINVDIRETRVALIENGIIAELHIERESSTGTLGNIYLGKVSRVLPGMQAAFIEVGLERAAFLHVEDLIRPDDFEAYLAGRRHPSSEEARGGRRAWAPRPGEPHVHVEEPDDDLPHLEASESEAEEVFSAPLEHQREGEVEASIALPTALDVLEDSSSGETDEEQGPFVGLETLDASGDVDVDREDTDLAPSSEGDDDALEASGALAPASDSDAATESVESTEPVEAAEQDAEESQAPSAPSDDDDVERGNLSPQDAGVDRQGQDPDASAAPDVDADGTSGDDAALPGYETEPSLAQASTAAPSSEDVTSAEDETSGAAQELSSSDALLVTTPSDAEPSLEGAPDASVDAGATTEEVPSVARARSGRTRSRREGRVRRSGRTRDRRAEIGAETEAAPPQERPVGSGERPEGARERSSGREGGRERAATPEATREGRETREGRDKEQPRGREGRGKGRERSREGRDREQPRGRDGRERGRESREAEARNRTPARARSNEPPRISKSTPIREVIREGQEIIVQISKEPIGTKGARVTSHVSLPGRYVVYLPTVDHIGISKRIGSEKERSRLRESIESMKPPQGGLIVRTLAEGLTKKQLKADVGYLVRLWGEIAKKRESGIRAPTVLYTELDLVLKTARDLFTDDIEKIVIDDRDEYMRLKRFVEMFMPERADAVEYYDGEEPIFDAYGIEDEIQRALARKVPLPSGGYLIIDQAEALTAIDVNTGRFVGKGSKDLEETILATNLEAVEEIAYQLRFRNIGGLIILDLIDMERAQNREKVRKRLEDLLARDKAKTTLNRISDLGLIEMTRKRTRESLGQMILEPCFYCDGTGQLQSKQTVAYEILRQIRRERHHLPGYSVVVNAHPAVIDLLKSDERVAVMEAERLFQRRIDLVPRKEYHLEQFDLQGR
ncbi:ribonuclease G [Chondromyces crocatus]|uniref:Ribonuclease G n=2 Tax=Chondromyces crocatus TaxID=52 RepID=A0A0K1ER37_CHOCO|nr:ribonuclease G [Chondromyces crocatus]